MAIKFNSKAQKMFLGDKHVTRVYQGDKIVYEMDTRSRYVQVSSADFDGIGNYTGTEKYIILPADKPSGYRISNSNVKGVATSGDYLTDASFMFRGYNGLYLELDYLDTSNVTNMESMFRESQVTTLDLSSFDTSSVTNMIGMFYGSQATTLDLSSFDTSNVTDMKYMFQNSQATTLDLSNFDTSNVTEMRSMFYGSQATTLDLSSFNTSNVTIMYQMFYGSQATTLDLSSFNTSSVTTMFGMFWDSKATSLDLSSFNTSNVTTMNKMFANSEATAIDLSSFNTSNVTDMESMFYNSQVTNLDLSSFDSSNVTTMWAMFRGSQATTLDLSSFDTNKVTNMEDMFYNSQATTLDLSSFDTSNVTNMAGMLNGSQATTLDLSNFDTSNVTTMAMMFSGNQATTLDLSSFDTSNVTTMISMFASSQATTFHLRSFDTSNVTDMNSMFYNTQATTLDLYSFDISNVTDMNNMFYGSQATNGYTKTQYVADVFNNSMGKPSTLTFVPNNVGDPEPQGFTTTGFGSSNGALENDSVLTRTTTSTSPTIYVWNSTLDDMYPFNVLGANSTRLVENGNTMLWVPPYYWTPTLSPEGYLREITISEEPISSESILSKGVWIGAGQTNTSYKSASGQSTKGNASITTFRSQSNWTNGAGKRYGAMNLYDWQSLKILMWVYFKSVRGSSFSNLGSPIPHTSPPTVTFKTSGNDITSYVNSSYSAMNYFFGFGYLLQGLEHFVDGVVFRSWNNGTMEMYATDDPSKYNNTGSGYNFIYRTPSPGYIKEVTVVNGLIVPAVTTGASRTTYYGSQLHLPNTSVSYTGLISGRHYNSTSSDSYSKNDGLNEMNGWTSFTDSHWSRGSRLRREE